jgi:hypothetical protein
LRGRFPGLSEIKISPSFGLQGQILIRNLEHHFILLESHLMPMKDPFSPDPRIHQLQSEPRGKARDRAATSSRILKRGLLVAVVTVLGFIVLPVENTAKILADVTASLVDGSALRPHTYQPAPISQSPTDAQVVSIAKNEPIDGESAASEPIEQNHIEQNHTEIREPSPEILFKQFQAWAAEKDAQQLATTQSAPDASVLQTAPARAVEKTAGSAGLLQKDRRVQRVDNARTRMSMQDSRKEIRRPQNAGVNVSPAQRTGAQASPASASRN